MKAGNYKIKWQYGKTQQRTMCYITDLDSNDFVAAGLSICSPKDHFCRDTGRKISLRRAFMDADIPKEERRVIWELYRNMTPKKRW